MQKPALWQIPEPHYSPAQIDERLQTLDARLYRIAKRNQHIVQMSSLAVEDMVITDAICRQKLAIDIAVLDTGLLNLETQNLIEQTRQHFDKHILIYQPLTAATEALIAENGKFGFYDSIEKRRACCRVRKTDPLSRALKGRNAWITGQRRSQSITRQQLEFEEHDSQHHCLKYNPIYDFSENDIWAITIHRELPVNPLYRRGYPSIGCAPCTKAVRQGEDIRAGRWWWEKAATKECGLHK